VEAKNHLPVLQERKAAVCM